MCKAESVIIYICLLDVWLINTATETTSDKKHELINSFKSNFTKGFKIFSP